jgi:hypothetical protein
MHTHSHTQIHIALSWNLEWSWCPIMWAAVTLAMHIERLNILVVLLCSETQQSHRVGDGKYPLFQQASSQYEGWSPKCVCVEISAKDLLHVVIFDCRVIIRLAKKKNYTSDLQKLTCSWSFGGARPIGNPSFKQEWKVHLNFELIKFWNVFLVTVNPSCAVDSLQNLCLIVPC